MIENEDDLIAERDYWRNVAAYLASCHAANAEYEGNLKRTSAYSRKRFAMICESAANAMTPFGFTPAVRWSDVEDTKERCAIAAADLLGKINKVKP